MAVDKLVDSTQLNADLTSVANAIRTKGGTSGSLAFPADFISAIEAISGGGGAEVIAEGTYTGDGNHWATIRIGARCPETDFVFLVWLDPEHILPVDARYKLVQLSLLVSHEFVRFDLSSSGSKAPSAQMSFTDANGASRAPNIPVIVGAYVVSDSVGRAEYQGDKVRLIRDADGFAVSVNRRNASCPFLDGATFHWRLIYYGADPANDIITI